MGGGLIGTDAMLLLALTAALHAAEPETADPAAEPTWWIGAPVQSVQIVSPGGGVPEESLDPLLRARQGERLDPTLIRLDLSTLFHAGSFATVEADVQPWVDFDENGAPITAAILKYQVRPAPRVGRIRFVGADSLDRAELRGAVSVSVGDVFFPEADPAAVAARLESVYRNRGFPDAEVTVLATPGRGRDRLDLIVDVYEGIPTRVDRVAVTGTLPLPERTLLRMLRRAGIEPGKPLTADAMNQGQYALRSRLARQHGYYEARVTPALRPIDGGGFELAYHIEPGKPVEVTVHGMWPWPESRAKRALAIDERLRLTRGFIEESPTRLTDWLARRGYRHAKADVRLEETETEKRLLVDVDRGARGYLVPRFGGRHRLLFEGNEHVDESELRAVMTQASEDVLRLGWVTEDAVAQAVEAVTDFYRARGYQNAQVERRLPDIATPRPNAWRLPGIRAIARWVGVTPPENLTLRFRIAEGALTRLDDVHFIGIAPEVDATPLEARRAALSGAPFSPQAVEQLARETTEAHRAIGYLEADTRVLVAREDGRIEATLIIQPGPRVLLRSTVFTGTQTTHTDFLRNQLDLTLGAPLTTADLERTRKALYDLGILRTVSTELIGDGAARDLVIGVVERPRYSFELGTGVSTDQGLRGFGRVTRNNLWGIAHRLALFGSASLDYQSDSITDWRLDIQDPEGRAALTYTAPRFPTRNQQFVVDLLLREQIQERTWRMARSGIGVSLEAELDPRTTLRSGVRLEARRLEQVDTGTILPGEPWSSLIAPGGLNLPTPWREQQSLSALLLHDRRDNPLQPSRGLLLSLLGEYGPGFTVGFGRDLPASSYIEGEAQFTGYIPLGGTVLQLSAEGARTKVLHGGVLALEDRYRVGGTGSMRGYPRFAVGPRNEIAQPDFAWPDRLAPVIDEAVERNPTRWVSTGGDTRALASAEWLIPLDLLGLRGYDGYSAEVFADVGNTWLLDATATSEFSQYTSIFNPLIRYGVGVGLRAGTPVGPLQIDVGLNPEAAFARGDKRKLLRDEWEEPPWRAHLSLGSLF